jgi:hypothetical protein
MAGRIPLLPALPIAAAITAVSLATSTSRIDFSKRSTSRMFTQDTTAQDRGKAVTAEKRRKARARQMEEETAEDGDNDDDAAAGRGRRECPAGQKPTPRRGRGGDFGGCISR